MESCNDIMLSTSLAVSSLQKKRVIDVVIYTCVGVLCYIIVLHPGC